MTGEDLLPQPVDESVAAGTSLRNVLLQFAIGGVVGAAAAIFVLRGAPDVSWAVMLWLLPAILIALWVHVLLHEAGHALAGIAVGFRAIAFGVGPVRAERGMDGWRLRWGGGLKGGVGGFALMLPPEGIALRRAPQAVYLLGGIAMNLGLATLSFIALAAFPEAMASARGALGVFAMIGVALGLANLVPFSAGGWMSDGANLRQLWRAPDEALAMFRMQQIVASSMNGVRPRDWPPALLPDASAAALEGSNAVALSLALFRLSRALDAGDDIAADTQARALAEVWPGVAPLLRPSLAISMAGYAAVRGDLNLLRAWRPLSAGNLLDVSAHEAWLDAEQAQMEGRGFDALDHARRAEAALGRIHDAGSRLVLAERLGLLRQGLSSKM